MSVRRLFAWLVAAALTAATIALSRAPLTWSDGDTARLRLSWRMESGSVGGCRTPTAEELEALPVHMRNPNACIGTLASYVLTVSLDGRPLVTDTVEPPGIHGDRPLSVLEEFALPAGRHALEVRFDPTDAPAADPRPEPASEGAEAGEAAGTGGGAGTGETAELAHLRWEGTLLLAPRQVALIHLDHGTGTLVLKTSTGGP